MVAYIHSAVLVLLIGIGGKDGVHRVCIFLGKLDARSQIQVAPGAALGCHVVAKRASQLIDEADFAISCGVLVGANLHLDVVGHVHSHTSRHALSHGTVHHAAERRVSDG